MKRNVIREKTINLCGECRHAEPVHRFHTLSISGKPTLAKCKYSPNRCRLMSEIACDGHFSGC